MSLVRTAELVEVAEPVRECRDPKDDQILELAVSKNASCIVTGDADLLVLNPFHNVKIVTPAQLIDLLDSGASG